ncbi:hypothetical protein HC928_09775 [bacterium]|nr:hypothetical protein [bacterium]
MQLVQWFKEAFDLPVLSLEETDARLATKSPSAPGQRLSLQEVMAALDPDPNQSHAPY